VHRRGKCLLHTFKCWLLIEVRIVMIKIFVSTQTSIFRNEMINDDSRRLTEAQRTFYYGKNSHFYVCGCPLKSEPLRRMVAKTRHGLLRWVRTKLTILGHTRVLFSCLWSKQAMHASDRPVLKHDVAWLMPSGFSFVFCVCKSRINSSPPL
jgi:hypothetical protein